MGIKAHRSNSVRKSLTAIFFLQGTLGTVMIPWVPQLIDQIQVNFAAWGAILGFSGLGALVGLSFASRLIVRFGSRDVLRVTSTLSALLLLSIPFVNNSWVFFAIQATMAFVGSCFNVALNTQAVYLQKILNRAIIGKMHAVWSIGAATSAAASAILATVLPMWLHFTVLAGLAAVLFFFVSAKALTPDEIGKVVEPKPSKKTSAWKMPVELWLISFGIFAGIFPEAAMMDWSAVFGKKILGLDAGLSALPYSLFMAAMIISRLSMGRLTKKRHVGVVSLWGGVFGSIAFGLGSFVGPLIAIHDQMLGFAFTCAFWFVAGLGIGPMSPGFTSAAGQVRGLTTAQALSRMSFISSLVFMGGKFLMGALAQGFNLVVAFALPTVLLLAAGLISGVLAKRATAEKPFVQDAFPLTGPIGIVSVAD